MAKLKMIESSASSRSGAVWRSCLSSSLRTTLACAIVACAKYYGPAAVRRHLALPALSYVTAVLIVTEAALGDALHGALCALSGTLHGAAPAALVLWAVGSDRFANVATATAAVAVSAFLVALPESTHVTAKRVALLQVVVVYVIAFAHGAATDPVMHPLQVGVSSGVGALAAVAAVLLPYPRLAHLQVRKKTKLFTKLSVERLRLLVNAFCAENNASAAAYISQAKFSTKACDRLLQTLKIKQGSLQWETLGLINRGTASSSSHALPADKLQSLYSTPMKGMEMALRSCPSFPLQLLIADSPEFGNNYLQSYANRISLRLMQLKHAHLRMRDSSTVHESDSYADDDTVPDHKSNPQQCSFRVPNYNIFPTRKDLPSFFFLFCMKLLHDESSGTTTSSPPTPSTETNLPAGTAKESVQPSFVDSDKEDQYYNSSFMRKLIGIFMKSSTSTFISKKRVLIALRCSLTLGLSVLFGMLFSRGNGFWGGLVIASSMTPLREPTYRAANTRLQGTVLGTIYGLLGCYVSQRLMEVRFIVLLPWFIFSTFLRRSRMYGPAGGVSAAVAAILIMGRKDYGSPSDFAAMRITETFIALACSIFVELLLQPTRASTLARFHLSETLNTLRSCLLALPHGQCYNNCPALKSELLPRLRGHVNELSKLVDEAVMEPNFWFLPFAGPPHSSLFGSLANITELLFFVSHAMELLHQEVSQRSGLAWKEILHETNIDGDLELMFGNLMSPSIKSMEDITRIKSLENLETDLQRKNNGSNDIESAGKTVPKAVVAHKNLICYDEVEMEKIIASFLQHSEEMLNRVADGDDQEVKTRMVLWLSGLGYCMEGLMKEVGELEKGIQELVQWENPSSHVNLYEISSKIRDLSS